MIVHDKKQLFLKQTLEILKTTYLTHTEKTDNVTITRVYILNAVIFGFQCSLFYTDRQGYTQ